MLGQRWSLPSILASVALLLALLTPTLAYQTLISSADEVCSGMYGKGKEDAFIEVLFSPSSRGQLALVVFEWSDAKYLGINQGGGTAENEWNSERVYICTLDALSASLCTEDKLGQFITTPATLPEDTSIFTASVRFDAVASAPVSKEDAALHTGPYRYEVTKTGYYCVGTVPVTLEAASYNTSFSGVVDFENVFGGHLPSGEYPKVAFYFWLTIAYAVVGVIWAILCFQQRRDLLPIQYYISATIGFLIFEIFMVYRYYDYLNEVGHPGVANLMLFFVAVLNAARNSLSFFMLLITAMGYGIVRPSLGPVMLKARLLAVVHFIFGVLYSVGTVIVPLESAGFFIFFFVFPLSFSLTAFLMWIMWSLNSTITDLGARRQTYKKSMFTKLYRILVGAVIVIGAFFVISSISFSNRLDEDFGPKTWQTRWILLDGWLGVLYFIVFVAIAFLWRPTANNKRLALSDELPTDEAAAEEFEVDGLTGEDTDDKDNVPLTRVGNDSVVFDVGEESDEEDEEADVGMHGQRAKRGENRPLKLDDESDEEEGPPRYKKED
ncbi:transmembrane receptor [Pseudohyphozyma bogoriensis]|nr:transmembrane receptor [Pseudohyphozyma bogoriensis]